MLTTGARIRTDRADRYLVQLCEHAGHVTALEHSRHQGDDHPPQAPRHVERRTEAVISFERGRCTLRATAQELVLTAEADDDEALRLMLDALTRRLELIGRRDHLSSTWEAHH